jgi:hypothetical protein
MKHLFNYSLYFFLLCGVVCAQEPTPDSASRLDEEMEAGMEVFGIRAPYYDKNGNLQVQLYGGSAKVLEDGRVDVSQIRIDVYDKGVVIMTVYAPQCFTQMEEQGEENILSIESDGEVLIETDQMTIVGRGFRFSSIGNRFEILSEAKVLVKESARQIKGMGDA